MIIREQDVQWGCTTAFMLVGVIGFIVWSTAFLIFPIWLVRNMLRTWNG